MDDERVYQTEEKQVDVDKTVGPLTNGGPNGIKHSLSTKQKREVLVLVNPRSGQGKSVPIYKKKLSTLLNAHDIDHQVFITESDSRVYDYIRNKTTSELLNLKSIIVVSGDGLFHETVNALMSREDWEQVTTVPIGIVPSGSGNGLAYTLVRQNYPEVESRDEVIRICCEQTIQDETSIIDLVKITFGRDSTIWSFLSFGWGLLADIDIDSEWLRSLGELRFTLYGLLRSITSVSYRGKLSFKVATPHLANIDQSDIELTSVTEELKASLEMYDTRCDETIDEDDEASMSPDNLDGWIHVEDKFACLYAVYQSYVSSVTNFAPKSTLTDQLIYLTYIRGKLSPCQAVEFMLSIKDGSHEKLPYVSVIPVTNFKFQPLESSKIVIDGEVIPWNLSDGPLTAEVVPKVIKLLWSSQNEKP